MGATPTAERAEHFGDLATAIGRRPHGDLMACVDCDLQAFTEPTACGRRAVGWSTANLNEKISLDLSLSLGRAVRGCL